MSASTKIFFLVVTLLLSAVLSVVALSPPRHYDQIRVVRSSLTSTSSDNSGILLADSITEQQVATPSTNKIRVASFNIQVLGVKKMEKKNVAATLVKLLSQYDVILVQEIRDSSDSAIHTLASMLNQNTESKKRYDYALSPRLGRSNSKEQYGVFYNKDLVKMVKTIQYEDANNWFERPPFIFVYSLYSSDATVSNLQFALLGCHVKPGDAVNEINHLKDVFESFKGQKFYDRMIIMGDLNAGCGYVSSKQLPNLSLRTDERFQWLITDSMDTTVAVSDCPYDRFICLKTMSQSKLADGKPFEINSVDVFKFDQRLSMTTAQAAEVSDHYPIELTIQTRGKLGKTQTLADLVEADFLNAWSKN